MKRWFIARMGDFEGDGGRVPKTNLYPCNSRIWSIPGRDWCLGQLAAADLTAIQADPDIFILPDAALDNTWGSVPGSIRTTVTNRVRAAGFTFAPQNTWSIRQVLVYLLQQIQPNLSSVEAGDVPDIEA